MTDLRDDIVALLPQLRAFARALTAGDVALSDDLVQDTVVKALQASDRFTAGTNLKAWLFTILRNNFLSVMRSKRVKAEVSDDGLENVLWRPPAQEDRLEFEAFKRAFRLLSPTHREVLVLICVHGHPYERAAEIVGCKVGTIRSRLNCRCRRRRRPPGRPWCWPTRRAPACPLPPGTLRHPAGRRPSRRRFVTRCCRIEAEGRSRRSQRRWGRRYAACAACG
jgi:RNA polymerase sigma-70 factor (ECF subfamily)